LHYLAASALVKTFDTQPEAISEVSESIAITVSALFLFGLAFFQGHSGSIQSFSNVTCTYIYIYFMLILVFPLSTVLVKCRTSSCSLLNSAFLNFQNVFIPKAPALSQQELLARKTYAWLFFFYFGD
jgi:hypothetical protein